MIYTEAEHFIKESHNGVIRLGLGRIEELLERLGCPQKKLKFIHVAGTNGKGSVCAMTAEILKAAGYKTGLFTSPVISVYREQFRINGEMISEGEFVRYAELVRNACAKMTDVPSEFEKAVALAFLYFNENRCDFVVLEVGMGGCDDATNVIEVPEVAAIVNIDYDHMGFLGTTLEEIAQKKAGIIKENGTVVIAGQSVPTDRLPSFRTACLNFESLFIKISLVNSDGRFPCLPVIVSVYRHLIIILNVKDRRCDVYCYLFFVLCLLVSGRILYRYLNPHIIAVEHLRRNDNCSFPSCLSSCLMIFFLK